MLSQTNHLASQLLEKPDYAMTRDGFGEAMLELGEKDPRVVALCADLAESTRMLPFREKFPERYIEVGVAEQNLATVASGLANYGKIPFIASYAAFSPGRNNEQIRTTISLNNVPVKIIGSHAGLSVGPDGATHQALEDIALMRVQPNMAVLSPCDKEEARKATLAAAAYPGPVYIRLAREKTPVVTTAESQFEIGKATELWRGNNPQVTIFVTGTLAHNALMAAQALASEISVVVVNLHTIKPLDEATIVACAKQTGAVVTVEEHQIAGGMGSAVAEVLAQKYPVPMEFIGIHDRFGQSGEGAELWREYKLDAESIQTATRDVFARKLI